MPAIPPKAAFQSALFTNNPPATQQALDACLAFDGAHIVPGQRGPAIAVIQGALSSISTQIDARIPSIKDSSGHFGDTTVTAVHTYKSLRDIVRPGMPLDDIVGRSTISLLDTEMLEVEGPQPTPPAPTPTVFKDVVVQILGFGGPNSSAQGQQQNSSVLRLSVASDVYNKKANRSLEAIKFIGGQQPNPTQKIAALVRTAILGSGAAPGFVCLTGESAGGKNVLQLANELANSGPQIPVRYAGISDGAFFDEDAVAKPNGAANNLLIKSPPFGGQKLNIFQSAGNGTEFSFSLLRDIWAGKMENKEVHGPIQGFKPGDRDLTAEGKIVAVPGASFETLHANAAAIANKIHLDNIRAILDGAP